MAFLSTHLPADRPHSREDVDEVSPHVLAEVEADSYWCLSKLIDSIQDHYTFAQPGIQRMVFKLKELVARIDPKLHNHLVEQGLHFIQFAFRWMNCLLMRELSLDLILRMWDTYLSEHGGAGGDANVASDSPSDGLAVRAPATLPTSNPRPSLVLFPLFDSPSRLTSPLLPAPALSPLPPISPPYLVALPLSSLNLFLPSSTRCRPPSPPFLSTILSPQ